MTDLIPPHGGLSEPVCRMVSSEEAESFTAEAASLPVLSVSTADLSTVYRIGDGTLSPLVGPMNEDVYNRVLDEQVIESEGGLYAWTIPLSLPASSDIAAGLEVGSSVALAGPDGQCTCVAGENNRVRLNMGTHTPGKTKSRPFCRGRRSVCHHTQICIRSGPRHMSFSDVISLLHEYASNGHTHIKIKGFFRTHRYQTVINPICHNHA